MGSPDHEQPLRRLPACHVTGSGFVHAAGRGTLALGSLPPGPSPWLEKGLSPMPAGEGVHWGRVSGPLPPLPSHLSAYESRCTQLLALGLAPLQNEIERVATKFGARRVGFVLGSSTGGIDATETALRTEVQGGCRPAGYEFAEAHPYGALLRVARGLSAARGPMYVISTACSSAGKALAAAQRLLALGVVEAVVSGGVDALSGITLEGFRALHLISPTVCRPFSAGRDGISLGEGATLFLLERAGPGPLFLLGAGESSDAYHPTAPHPDGLGARLALRRCLQVSGLRTTDVAYVQAHGTGTLQNDAAESRAIHDELGDVPFSSTKDRTGHQLGAAAATSTLFCLDALTRNEVHGALTDEASDERLPAAPLRGTVRLAPEGKPTTVLASALAFGGNNVTLALGRGRPPPCGPPILPPGFDAYAATAWRGGEAEPPRAVLSTRAWGRASVLTRLYAWLVADLAEQAELSPEELSGMPLFLGSGYGELETSLTLLDQLAHEQPLSPAKFQSSVHNTAAGLLTIALDNHAPSSALSAGDDTWAMTLLEAMAWLGCHGGTALVLMADEAGPKKVLGARAFGPCGGGLLLGSPRALRDSAVQLSLPRVSPIDPAWQVGSPDAPASPPHAGASPAAWALPLVSAIHTGGLGDVAVAPTWATTVSAR